MADSSPQKARYADPDQVGWVEYVRSARYEEVKRVEDAAKFLATLISLSFSLLLALGKNGISDLSGAWLIAVKVAIGLWMLAALLALIIIVPFPWKVRPHDPEDIEASHNRLVREKRRILITSIALFFAGMLILGLRMMWL